MRPHVFLSKRVAENDATPQVELRVGRMVNPEQWLPRFTKE
jgi:hypothetical protein